MEHGIVLAGLFLVTITVTQGATVTPTTTCTNSYECGTGMCCRNANGDVITNQEMDGFGPAIFEPSGNQNGTCSTRKAQENEICDSDCQCDTGLACYRPMSGVCCPPMRCYDEHYVEQQKEYWANCLKDPNCAIPP